MARRSCGWTGLYATVAPARRGRGWDWWVVEPGSGSQGLGQPVVDAFVWGWSRWRWRALRLAQRAGERRATRRAHAARPERDEWEVWA